MGFLRPNREGCAIDWRKVRRIGEMQDSMGRFVPTVEIVPDGEQTVWEGVKPPEVTDLPSFLEAVRQSGVVGLGGAGFPTAVKLGVKDGIFLVGSTAHGWYRSPDNDNVVQLGFPRAPRMKNVNYLIFRRQ